jgi:hypothetical protein
MDTTETQNIAKGDRVIVTMSGRTRSKLAVVTQEPSQIGRWTLITFAYVKIDGGPDNETLSRHDHTATVGQDKIEKAR